MIQHTLDPIALQLGPLSIRWYSLAYIFGILAAYWVLRTLAKQNKVKNLTVESTEDIIAYLTLALILGGRLGYVLFYAPYLIWTDPLEIIKIWNGGMSFHGALIGLSVAGYFLAKKHNIHPLELGDVLVVPGSLALVFGRIANFINAELIGTVSNSSWCIQYENVEGCRHPSQLYEAAKNLAIFGILYILYKKQHRRGTILFTFIFLYGILRFLVNFYRDDPILFIFSTGQWLCLGMIIIGSIGLWKIMKK